ncbi:MAG: hypothetical protein QNJ73_07230 [Gammaproteobacteria bacterium]|nr:hypothetical protein [Gammaproteobacteria bacterium]
MADGASAIYSFANDLSLPGIVKHQRRTAIGALPVMFRLLRPVRGATAIVGDWLSTHLRGQVSTMATLPGSATAGPMPDNWQASRDLFTQLGWSDARFSPDDTALFANAADLPRINMKRDGDQLNWRYRDAIGATYLRRDLRDKNGLVATLVIRPLLIAGLKVVFVMEWHWQQKASGQEMVLMEELLDSARKAGVHAVAALSMAGTRQSAKLRRNGFFQVPSALLPANATLTVGPETDMIERYHWFEPANWYLTWGDGFLI